MWVVLQYARVCFDYVAVAHENVVARAQVLATRTGFTRSELEPVLGASGYEHLVSTVAKAYARLGRVPEAQAILDAASSRDWPSMHAARAEIGFPADAHGAMSDLQEFFASATTQNGYWPKCEFLHAHLALNAPDATPTVEITHPEIHIALANFAARRGDSTAYFRHVNHFFQDHGLVAVAHEPPALVSGIHWNSPRALTSRHDALVTIIMTAFNAEATLEMAIGSLLNQSHAAVEILLVDDDSTDATLRLAHELADGDNRIRVLRTERNSGTYAAKNIALPHARGSYVTFHDADDWAHPQRIEKHLDAMANDERLVATRSNWLRLSPDGAIQVRRWGMTASHANPASVFLARDAIPLVGVFDRVRFGADSEHWARLVRLLPPGSTQHMRTPLGIGMLHDASLTRSGAGAMNSYHYSALRSAYQLSWTEHHATAPDEALVLQPEGRRAFWAPEAMLRRSGHDLLPDVRTRAASYPVTESAPRFAFGITLDEPSDTDAWIRSVELVDRALHAIRHQSDPRWHVYVMGPERPDLASLLDPRVSFVEVPATVNAARLDTYRDMSHQWDMIDVQSESPDGAYVCHLNGADLAHTDLVAHVLADDNRRGYVATLGYFEDYDAGTVTPISNSDDPGTALVRALPTIRYRPRERAPEWPLGPMGAKSAADSPLPPDSERGESPVLDPLPFAAWIHVPTRSAPGPRDTFGPSNNHSTPWPTSGASAERFVLLRDQFGQR